MGRLTYLTDINSDARWYFPDAVYLSEKRAYSFEWPSLAYPHTIAIHNDDLSNENRIIIRKWIEVCLSETVIVNTVDRSYRRFIDEEKSWDKSYEVSNIWTVFYFDNEQSETMFRLRFSQWIKPVTYEHPRWIE